MTEPARPPLTERDVAKLHNIEGLDAARANILAWVTGKTISGPDLVAELRYWLKFLGG